MTKEEKLKKKVGYSSAMYHCPQPHIHKGMEERFDKLYFEAWYDMMTKKTCGHKVGKILKQFITSEITQAQKEWLKRKKKALCKTVEANYEWGKIAGQKELLERVRLEKVKVPKSHKGKSYCPQCEDRGYNYAVADLETLKKSIKKGL